MQGVANQNRAASNESVKAGSARENDQAFPRILQFDLTAIGDGTATGEIKANILGEWPHDKYLQVFSKSSEGVDTVGGPFEAWVSAGHSAKDLAGLIRAYEPQVIIYRPVPDSPALHRAAMEAIASYPQVPLVTWIMDDWPARLEIDDPKQYAILNADWIELLRLSTQRLSISKAMSEAFQARYGYSFRPFANGIDPRDWPLRERRAGKEFVLRYAGGLAHNMTAESIRRVAVAVEELASEGRPIRMEIHTRTWWKAAQEKNFAPLRHTKFSTKVLSTEAYRRWISDAGAVLIAYNFDDASLRYVQHSLANKLPECLASGSPLLAVGPRTTATMAYLSKHNLGLVVDNDEIASIRAALTKLMDDSGFARQLSDRARNAAMRNHNVVTIRSDFRQMLAETAQSVHKPPESRVSEPSSGHADGVSSQPPASVVAVAAPASSGAVASSNVNNNNNDTGSRKRTVTGPIEEPLYTRFALWASRRNPIVFRVGQFAMWCLRSAKRQLGATILLLVLLAALLIYPQYYALSPRTTLAAQIVAAALVGLALLVAVIGYAGHLASRNRDELRARLDAQERQVKSLDNRRTQNDLALRQFVDGGMGRLDEVSSRLDASIAHSDTALRKFVGAEIRRLEYEKDALAAEVRRLEAVSGESKNRSQADYDNSEVAIGKLHGELNRLGAAFAALAERDGSAKKQSADDVGRLQGELAALRSSVSANAADLAETQSVIAGFASEREVAARELQSLLSATAKRTDEVTAEFGREMEKRLNVAEESRRERMAAVTEQLGMIETRLTDRLADHRAQLDLRLSQMPEIDQIKLELFERLGALETEVKSSVANLPEDLDGRIASIRAEIERAMEARFSEVGGSASKELSGLRVEVEQRLGQIEASREERVEHVTDHLNSIEAKLTERLVALTSDIGEQLAELPATRDSARELMDRVAKVETDLVGNLEGASSQFEDAKAAIAKTLADELHAELARKVAEVEKSAMERVALGPVQLEAAKAGIIENLTRQLQAELARQMAAMEKSTQEKISQSPELLAGLDKQITDRMAAIQASIQEAANKAPADLEKIKAELAARISVVEKVAAEGVSKTDEKLKPLPEVQARTDQRIRQMEQLTRSASVYNISRFQRFNRTLRDPDIETLIADWSKPLGLDLNKARLGYLAHRCCQLESQMKGRFATTVEALVLRCLVASAPKRNQVSILEIGTLFGVGAAAVYEAARNQFDKVHLTVIDPLDGYYAEGNRDILTGENISEATLLQNWGQAQIPSGDFTVIKRLSNHSDAIESAAKREYDLLIIDGDHTYDGVKYDFDTYVGMVRPGGYVLFDDYDVEEWPDIKRYVDNEIESLPYLYRTGAGFRSAVFQVKKSPAKPKKKNKRG